MSGQLKKERVVSFHHLGAGNELSIRGRRSCVRRVPLTGMRRKVGPITAGIRAVESFDSSFELQPDAKETLVKLLSSDTFCNQVGQQPGVPPSSTMQFTGELFQPTPWSVNTKFGMPQEYEKYLEDKDNYVIINVPPNYMFQAKIFKPSRLCAIFRVASRVEQGVPVNAETAA